MESKQIIEWGLLALFFLGLIYTMIVIKEEKQSYQDSAVPFTFRKLQLLLPSWWSKTLEDENQVCFERTDTRYDWKATLKYLPFSELEHKSLPAIEESFLELIKNKELLFDEVNSVVHTPSDFSQHPLVLTGEWEIVRLEGTASEKMIERLYYDAYMIRDHRDKAHYFCESRSSVLNGLVEGPYFEEMMNKARRI